MSFIASPKGQEMKTLRKTAILMMTLIAMLSLAACGSDSNKENNKELKVLTVEFSSGSPVPELYVTLSDASNGKEVDSVIGSQEGEALFDDLKDGHNYIVAATTLKNSVLGEGYTTVEQFTYDSTKPYYLLQTHSARDYQQLDVPVVMQNPELPNGCEITALTAVLNYYGVAAKKTEMAEKYLAKQAIRMAGEKKYGADPNKEYTGNPASKDGTYVFAAPIVEAAEKAIIAKDASLRVTDVSGQTQEEILALVKEGVPVVVWVTLDLTEPRMDGGWVIDGTNDYHEMYENLHVVVLTGHLGDKVVVMDPLKGYVTYSDVQFFKSYKELGKQAVAVHK